LTEFLPSLLGLINYINTSFYQTAVSYVLVFQSSNYQCLLRCNYSSIILGKIQVLRSGFLLQYHQTLQFRNSLIYFLLHSLSYFWKY